MSQFRQTGKNHIESTNDFYSSSFTPRRLAHRSKNSRSEQIMVGKGKKRFIYFALSLAFLSLVIIAFLSNNADGLLVTKKNEMIQPSGTNPIEKQVAGPIIEEDEAESKEDQHFAVSNVKELVVELRAVRGESTLFLDNEGGKRVVLRQGDKEIINGEHVWFRLGKPSNVDVFINNKIVTTRAQDQEKSYSFTKKTL